MARQRSVHDMRAEVQREADELDDAALYPVGSDPWAAFEPSCLHLLPVMVDAGLLWIRPHKGSGLRTDSGSTVGEFAVLENGSFVYLDDYEDILSIWLPALNAQLQKASDAQVRRYATWLDGFL